MPKGLEHYRGNPGEGQDADRPIPGVTQYIPADPGPPPLEQYATATPVRVRVIIPTLLPSFGTYSISYCASDCRRCSTTTPPVTYYLFLAMSQSLLEEIRA